MTTPNHPADRLLHAVRAKAAPVCVGIDPVWETLPPTLQATASPATASSISVAITSFGLGILEAVAAHVPCVKVQSACYERYGAPGVFALQRTIASAKQLGLEVILDAKRGDVGHTAAHYATAVFGELDAQLDTADWITLNGYLGADAIEPFLRPGRGAFVLVRTSNPGGDAVQSACMQSGLTVAEHVAGMVADLGDSVLGECGYSAVGAVVGATKAKDMAALRARMPRQIFLVPGIGAQGGTPDDVKPCFDDEGAGVLLTASRSIINAWQQHPDRDWPGVVSDAAARLADETGQLAGWR
jgi:orotidine-5'-phosphate decarboxylase